ncbi:MAG: hypothetical protein HQK51_11970 [Oligoflexia bacterium]|nr:hypothetical protein [Oligoflexia bacterium]
MRFLVIKNLVRMFTFYITYIIFCILFLTTYSCQYVEKIEKKAKAINQYEMVSLEFAKENRQLKTEIGKLEFEIQNLKSRNSYLELKLKQNKIGIDKISAGSSGIVESNANINAHKGRGIASVASHTVFNKKAISNHSNISDENDPIGFELYNWKPEQLVTMANTSFSERDYVKATEYFKVLIKEYPNYHEINDQMYFMAGVSAYNSGKYYDLAQNYLTTIISRYPSSSFYRGAKLWLALTNFKVGNSHLFFKTVDEFRLKYRNTEEWKILSTYYENYRNKYKK